MRGREIFRQEILQKQRDENLHFSQPFGSVATASDRLGSVSQHRLYFSTTPEATEWTRQQRKRGSYAFICEQRPTFLPQKEREKPKVAWSNKWYELVKSKNKFWRSKWTTQTYDLVGIADCRGRELLIKMHLHNQNLNILSYRTWVFTLRTGRIFLLGEEASNPVSKWKYWFGCYTSYELLASEVQLWNKAQNLKLTQLNWQRNYSTVWEDSGFFDCWYLAQAQPLNVFTILFSGGYEAKLLYCFIRCSSFFNGFSKQEGVHPAEIIAKRTPIKRQNRSMDWASSLRWLFFFLFFRIRLRWLYLVPYFVGK